MSGPRLRIFDYGGKPQRRRFSHTPKNIPTPKVLFLLGFRPLYFVKTLTAFFCINKKTKFLRMSIPIPRLPKRRKRSQLTGRRRLWQTENMTHTFLATGGLGPDRYIRRGQGRVYVGPELWGGAGTGSVLSQMSEQGRTLGLSLRKSQAVTCAMNLRKDRAGTHAGNQGTDGAGR